MLPPPSLRGAFRTDERARAVYSEGAGIYRIVPTAVASPSDRDDLVTLVHWATEHRTPLIPRGAGSAMGGGNVGGGVVVDLTRFPRRLDVFPAIKTAITSNNVTAVELNTATDRHGLRLPPDPSSARWATLGGMASTNAAGARSVRYGSVRRWVEGLQLVTADAEVVELRRMKRPSGASAIERFEREVGPEIEHSRDLIARRFPHTRKNSSGYALDAFLASGDALDLVIGAEGTLGFVTEIEWRLDPIPSCRAGLRVGLRSLDDLVAAAAMLLAQEPSAVELLDRSFLDLVRGADLDSELGNAEAILLVEFERSEPQSLRRAVEVAAEAVRPWATQVDTALSTTAAERLWSLRHAASPILARLPEERRSLQVIEDACLPLERMGDYIRAVRRIAAAHDLPVVIFGHAGDGHVHVNLLPDVTRPGWERAVQHLLEEVTDSVLRLNGSLSGEHGDGRLRAGLLQRAYGREIVGLFEQIKRAFDPLGIMNPGVILSDGVAPISRLKVGHEAAAIPSDIASELRRIEREGGYGRYRMDIV